MSLLEATPVVLLYMIDEDELVALSARLTSLGLQVLPVGSLDEARRAVEEHSVDCAFIEVRTTHPEGLSVIRNIKLSGTCAPLVVLSSNKDLASRIAGRDAGAEHYLATPIRNIDLEMKFAELRKSAPLGAESVRGSAELSRDELARAEAVPLPLPSENEWQSEAHRMPLPEADTALVRENEELRERVAELSVMLASALKSEEAALRDVADLSEEMQRRDGAAQLALSQARALADAARSSVRQAPSIAGGHLPETDELTGLIGAGPLQDHLDREFARARRYGHPLALLMLDLDRLARYNKSYGTAACERALCLVADVLRSALRTPDIAARLGDDDFVVLATDTTEDQAFLLAQRLHVALREEGQHTSLPPITLSIGIASSGAQGIRRAEDLLKAAQEAVRKAKTAGRDCSVIA